MTATLSACPSALETRLPLQDGHLARAEGGCRHRLIGKFKASAKLPNAMSKSSRPVHNTLGTSVDILTACGVAVDEGSGLSTEQTYVNESMSLAKALYFSPLPITYEHVVAQESFTTQRAPSLQHVCRFESTAVDSILYSGKYPKTSSPRL